MDLPLRVRRRFGAAAATLILLSVLTLLGAGPAGAADAPEQDFLARINGLRTSLGVAPLAVDDNLMALSQAHSAEMAARGELYHTPDLVAGVTGSWQELGENVGVGGYTSVIWDAFVKSPHHYENLVNPAFTHVGIGVTVTANGSQWVTHRFRQAAPAPRPRPTAPPVTAPPVTAAPVTAPPVTTPPVTRPAAPPPTIPPTTAPVVVPVPALETTTTTAPPPPVVEPGPADSRRVSLVLDALRRHE